jgi:hypothetical protein
VDIECPQDKIIIRLNAELNKTYLWYGAKQDRDRYAENQVAQDSNAVQAGGVSASSRAIAKAGSAYSNRNRDLVDTLAEDGEILQKVKQEELPDALKDLSLDEREAYVKKMAAKRAEVQKEISSLAAERETYLAKERKRLAEESGDATLGDAVVSAIRRQLANSGFENAAIAE